MVDYIVMFFMMLDAWAWFVFATLIVQLIPLFLGVYLFQKKKNKIKKKQVNLLSLICLSWYLLPIFSQILYYLTKYISEFVLGNQWESSPLEVLSEFVIPSFMLMPIVLIITIIIAFVFLVKFIQKKYKLKKDKKQWIEIGEERMKVIENIKIFTINLFASPLLVAAIATIEIVWLLICKLVWLLIYK